MGSGPAKTILASRPNGTEHDLTLDRIARMTTFFLIRHATNDFVGWKLAGRAPGTHLNAEGRLQAEKLAEHLGRKPIDRVYSSPLERARETAQPLCDRHRLEARIADDLIEIDYGDWLGKAVAELESNSVWQRYNTFRSGTRAPGGELMLDAQLRVVGFMQRLAEECPGQTIALVSHGDIVRAAVLYYLGAPLDCFNRLEVSPASFSEIRVSDSGPVIHGFNQTAD
jgi:broad specificity phosphatase PhoE